MKKTLFNPREIIPAFDAFLGQRGLSFKAVAVGGAALSILGVIARHTRDLDLLEPTIPGEILEAAGEFARSHGLSEDWLNTGPASLSKDLPSAWVARTQPLYLGQHLTLATLSRLDLIRVKLWAMCDRMRDLEDLVALAPTEEELAEAEAWVTPLDGNPDWPAHVALNVSVLRGRLGRG